MRGSAPTAERAWGERPPGGPPSTRSAALDEVMAGARVIAGVIAASLAETDAQVSLPQLRVLAVTADRGALTVGDVAELLEVHASNATRLVDRMVERGWMERQADPLDRRQRRLTLTAEGRALVASVMSRRRAGFEQLLDRLPAASRDQLVRGLAALAGHDRPRTDADTWVVPTGPRRI